MAGTETFECGTMSADGAPVGLVAETVYDNDGQLQEDVSVKVQSLAKKIYDELERLMKRYDSDVVKEIMPLSVTVLEALDRAHKVNQVREVELELLKEDNEQLVTQYEREKAARKHSEQRLLESEDHYEGEKKELLSRLESVDSIVRMLELKYKNSTEHSARLEERENELKKEYSKLHDRYSDLFKTHVDYMERTKLLLSTASDRGELRERLGITTIPRSSGPVSFGFTSLEGSGHAVELMESMPGSPDSASSSSPISPPIGAELAAVHTSEKAHQTDALNLTTQATSPVAPSKGSVGKSQTRNEKRSGNTLYQELAFPDSDNCTNESEEGPDYTGSWVHPGEYASSVNDNYFGMGKEVENLILENNELLATKNALNIVKDDLIVKVDELTGEQEILREEVGNLSSAREKLRNRVTQLEEELRRLKETLNSTTSADNEDEADVPMAQRKRFTRVEMARVLMERNQYKERFMELQEAVRFTEMVRANRIETIDKKNKQSIWTLFSNLFSGGERPQRPLSTPHMRAVATAHPAIRHSRTQADFLESQLSAEHQQRRRERNDQFRQVRAHVRKEDGRTQAYGWSLPGKSGPSPKAPSPGPCASLSSAGLPVPVPVFCRPITESDPRMTLLCAAGVDLRSGPAAYHNRPTDSSPATPPMCLADEIHNLTEDSPAGETTTEASSPKPLPQFSSDPAHEENLSSMVWICSSSVTHGTVMIIDANNPAEILSSFTVSDKHILCIAAVPGASVEDLAECQVRAADHQDYEPWLAQALKKNEFVESQFPSESFPANSYSVEGGEPKEVVVGSSRLVRTRLLSPASEARPTHNADAAASAPDEPAGDTDAPSSKEEADTSVADSPPLESFASEVLHDGPERGVDAFAEEQGLGAAHEPRQPTTAQATMWLGTKTGCLYVHSALTQHSRCLASVKLSDAILAIVPCASRCVVALADGTVSIFSRETSGQWDLTTYWSVVLGDPKCSVRCLGAVGPAVWCGYRNRVHVLEPNSRALLHSLEAHPRHESQVRQLAWQGDGVWISIKMDSTLRLYHAHTYHHLKDVDIEPYVSKMLGTGKLGFSLVRITALLISSGRLWIGTSNGVVISVPLSESPAAHRRSDASGAATPPSCLPLCSMAHAQLSFHGHRDAVTFFVAVPGAGPASPAADCPGEGQPTLVISGGEGYIDFRIADSELEESATAAEDEPCGRGAGAGALAERACRSHLIVWQVAGGAGGAGI